MTKWTFLSCCRFRNSYCGWFSSHDWRAFVWNVSNFGQMLGCSSDWILLKILLTQTSTQCEPSRWFLCQLRTWYLSLLAQNTFLPKFCCCIPSRKSPRISPGPRISRFCESLPWHFLPHMCLRRVVRFGKSQRVLQGLTRGWCFILTNSANKQNFQLL